MAVQIWEREICNITNNLINWWNLTHWWFYICSIHWYHQDVYTMCAMWPWEMAQECAAELRSTYKWQLPFGNHSPSFNSSYQTSLWNIYSILIPVKWQLCGCTFLCNTNKPITYFVNFSTVISALHTDHLLTHIMY